MLNTLTTIKQNTVLINTLLFRRKAYLLFSLVICTSIVTVNQQILAATKFGVSQNKVIWLLLNLASPCLCSVRSRMLARQILAKTRNSPNSPNIMARHNLLIYSIESRVRLFNY